MPKYLVFLLFAVRLFGQSNLGELRLKVMDPAGLGLQASVALICEANQFRQTYITRAAGDLEARGLPFGVYRLRVTHQGFSTYSGTVEIRSAIPANLLVSLSVATVQTSLVVKDPDTLVDPHRTGTTNRMGPDAIGHATIALPGRSVIELVNAQPGWVLESNGALHPRGSEYQTQYVVDGVPLTDNRSPSFAAPTEVNDVESMTVLTANFPAEYGRKLGGVIEISTIRNPRQGFHGRVVGSGGSFSTADGSLMVQDSWGKNTAGMGSEGAITARYLDPPVLENFTNHATTRDFAAYYERDLTGRDRVGATIRHSQAVFQVPNQQEQENAGQRQDRNAREQMGIIFYQHLFSPDVLGNLRVMSRDDLASLVSNDLSQPIIAGQERSFREGYVKGSVSVHRRNHELKAGLEVDYGSIHERFNCIIADPAQFDPGTPGTFNFAGRGRDREQAGFAQDLVRLGQWTVSAGVRWDRYNLLVENSALSPRLGIARYWPWADMVFHASYDRVFQTPAFENILLSSSSAVTALNAQVLRLPVQPSHGDFYEAGLTKNFFGNFRLSTNYYQRVLDNYADDDLLLNTGIGFPIAFQKGRIYGAESKLEIPGWNRVSGFVSYSYMVGFGHSPVTGGLFLGDEVTRALNSTGRFPVTQDQRNTVSSRLRYQLVSRAWAAFGGSYGSGLPTEFSGTPQVAIQQFGQAVANRINFDRGRVRPSLALNASVGTDFLKRDRVTVRLQADIQNLTNRINVINFSGLFSGTGIAPSRSYAVRLDAEF